MIANCGTDDGEDGTATLRREASGGVDLAFNDAPVGLAGRLPPPTQRGQRGSDGRVHTLHLLGYGSGEIGPISLCAGIGYAWADNRVDRS